MMVNFDILKDLIFTKTCTINLKTMAKTLNDLNGTMLDKSQRIVVMLPEIEKYVCKCISEL